MVCKNIKQGNRMNHITLGCMEAGEGRTLQKPQEPLRKAAYTSLALFLQCSRIGCRQSGSGKLMGMARSPRAGSRGGLGDPDVRLWQELGEGSNGIEPRCPVRTLQDALQGFCEVHVTLVPVTLLVPKDWSCSHNWQWMHLMESPADKMLEMKTGKRNGERIIFK